ncbi:hypothetical protein [Maricaulis sp.]|uniref:hypothetical protein n=1 Tax=Maricaulis sp. TaxID=1486257 RepID=UPI003A8FDFBD
MVSPIEINQQDSTTRLIRQAAQETGTDFNFLLRTAARESNFDATAQATTSSAAGMYQFIEQTWLGVMQRHGAEHGHGDAAQSIVQGENGRLTVADPAERERILDLRFEPETAARMAGELAAENAQVIQSRLGRPASGGELYAAHFLGANGAAGLIAAAEQSPDIRADDLFPQAAQANRPIFYDGNRARSASEVLASLTGERPVVSLPAGVSDPLTASRPASGLPSGRYSGALNPGSHRVGDGELSPALVEILASLDAPASARTRET